VLDRDLQRFANGLNTTQSGYRLRLATHESRIAVSQIERLRQLGGRDRAQAIDSWQRAYIKASDNAAKAIDALWDAYQWPTDGARARGFHWQPTHASKE
jgi:hypothetical protein